MVQKPGFLFDNDGVLIDSSELHWKAWQLLMAEDPSFQMAEKQFINGFGKRNDLILQEVVPHVPQEKRKKWAERKEELFRSIARGRVSLLPGMEAFLEKVKKKDISRIIASSTPLENLRMYIHTTVLGRYFDAYMSGEEVAHGKPFPDIFLAAAKRIGYEPHQTVVFEDAPAGILAGKKAGCFVVALATTHKKEELKGYDLFYPTAHELDLDEIISLWEKYFLKRG